MKKEYEVRITKQAIKNISTLPPKLKRKLKSILLEVLTNNPYEGKKLIGELAGNDSLRLTLHDRIVYSIDEGKKIVFVKRVRTHYGK
jgi:mRNA-degrading endonuclease RelE of RelBE toxin-antitoxin system